MLQQYCNATQPADNLTMSIPWTRATPEVIPGMSAIAYLTAVQLLINNPSVPIGAVASSWGGTAMEPWMPADALKACGKVDAYPTDATESSLKRWLPAAVDVNDFPDQPSVLWNSMIHPLTRLAIAGIYWHVNISDARSFCLIFLMRALFA
jgi:sialate O-acetylesterase